MEPPCEDWIIVLAKEPRLGLAKTRLARDVGAEAAQELAEAFVIDTLELVQGLARTRAMTKVLIAYAPDDARAWFAGRAPGAELLCQPPGDLGARMEAAGDFAFESATASLVASPAASPARARCVMIGMDTPHLDPSRLDAAFDALALGSDAVFGPSEDGGYYLVGLSRPLPVLFAEIPWSTAAVLDLTMERAAAEGLRVHQLPTELDVDDGADLARLAAALVDSDRAPATQRALSARL